MVGAVVRADSLSFRPRPLCEYAPAPMPPDARRTLFIYNLFFPLVFLGLLPGFLVRMLRRGNFRADFGQRLGFYSAEARRRLAGRRPIWIHSISVGETMIALKLARALHERDPAAQLVLSTTTTTGYALAGENAADWLVPLYNPIDFRPIVRRALAVLRPAQIILIEGEAWPNLLAESTRRNIPVALVNARLSPRSERRFQRFRAWTGPIFRLLEQVLVPEAADIARWQGLGVPAERLYETGSIKFDQAAGGASRVEEFRRILADLGVPESAPVLVAGSTFPGEEKLLAELLREWRLAVPDLFLIVVPRHVERVPAILRELEPAGLRIVRRTEPRPGGCDLLLVDTTGELRDWYALATVVFVGKSLTAVGGQNPVEPALLGKPVVFGPHMENFAAVVPHLLAHEAAVQVPDAAALAATVRRLLADPAARASLARHAQMALASHQGATARAAAQLLPAAP